MSRCDALKRWAPRDSLRSRSGHSERRPETMKINHEEHEDFFCSFFVLFVSSWFVF